MNALLIYLAGLLLIAAVAWAPAHAFFRPNREARPIEDSPAVDRWEKQKNGALEGIREAEFDFQVGKLSEVDYRTTRRRLEAQALEAIAALEKHSGRNAGRK